jgi:hypothetical protein
MPLSTIFQLYFLGVSFIGGRNMSTHRKAGRYLIRHLEKNYNKSYFKKTNIN